MKLLLYHIKCSVTNPFIATLDKNNTIDHAMQYAHRGDCSIRAY